jgi:hypothetical protein
MFPEATIYRGGSHLTNDDDPRTGLASQRKRRPGSLYAGKLNSYIALVDDRLRREAHAGTVGI